MHTHGATDEENGRVSATIYLNAQRSLEVTNCCMYDEKRNRKSQQVKWKQKKFIHLCTIEDETELQFF